jgi:hypothetical protein
VRSSHVNKVPGLGKVLQLRWEAAEWNPARAARVRVGARQLPCFSSQGVSSSLNMSCFSSEQLELAPTHKLNGKKKNPLFFEPLAHSLPAPFFCREHLLFF